MGQQSTLVFSPLQGLWQVSFSVTSGQCDYMGCGMANLAPPLSSRPKCSPMTINIISSLSSKFDHTKPPDAAVFACLTTTFFSAARLGEFTLPSLKSFVSAHHIKPSDILQRQDRHGLKVTVFKTPCTKTSIHGEEVFWAAQQGPSDPQAALANHLTINSPLPDLLLFSWRLLGDALSSSLCG